MKESQIQVLLKKLIEEAKLAYPACFELKLEKGKSFAFSKVDDHQIYFLQKAKQGFYYKVSDMAAISGFASPKPFDCLWILSPVAMLVICFYSPRKYKKLYFIDVDNFVKLKKETAPRKSVTMDMLDCSPFVSLSLSLPGSLPDKLGSSLRETGL